MAKILVVDDEQAILNSLERFLKQEGHDAVLATDGLEALAILNETRVEVAFVDVVMPTVDGLTLMRRMLQDHPHVKIIVMSAFADVIDLPARELGLMTSLQKPFTLDEVQAALESATNRITL